jgi:hypothetical protein
MRVKMPDVLYLAQKLRADSRIDWSSVVGSDRIVPDHQSGQGMDVSEALKDLPKRVLPIQDSLGLDPKNLLGNWLMISLIASAERKTGKPLDALRTTEELVTALDAFKSSGPDLLFSLWRKKRLDKQQLRLVLLDVWRYTDHTAYWPAHWWRRLFRETGFLSDGPTPPKRPFTVYRGCTPEGRRGFSWTLREFRAEKFGNSWFEQGYSTLPGHVFKLRVRPRDVLAMISGHKSKTLPDGSTIRYGGEDEVIVDARYLKPVLVETWQQRWRREVKEGVRPPEDLELIG